MTASRDRYTAHDIPDLLAVLPVLFGFTPKDSFIAIATEGERVRLGFRLRMDLPAPEHARAAAAQAACYLRRQDPDGAILIALTDDAERGDAILLAALAELDDLRVYEAVRAGASRYWVYTDGPPAQAVDYVARYSEVVAEAVFAGRQILPDREALVARFGAVGGARKVRMQLATERARKVMAGQLGPGVDDRVAAVAALGPIIDGFGPGSTLSDAQLATLAVWVSSPRVRDEIWSRMSVANAASSLALWTAVAQSVVAPYEPSVLCLAAFAAWLSGDGAQALIAVERALDIQPDHRMAHLIVGVVMSAISPRNWEGFDPGDPLAP